MLSAFSITDIGKKRQLNQDYVFVSQQPIGNLPNLFVVADGMGGHKAGDFASKFTVETLCNFVKRSFEKNPILIMEKAIETANDLLRQKAREDVNLEGMGTTLVAATCLGKYLQIANVGDSRLYIVNDEIKQITRDHSWVEEMVRIGSLDRESARKHPDKNIITRAIGACNTVEADYFTVELTPNDTILMCSDGLTNMLEDEEILRILSGPKDLDEKGQELIEAANEQGGKDNIAVVLIKPFTQA